MPRTGSNTYANRSGDVGAITMESVLCPNRAIYLYLDRLRSF